MDEHFSRQPFEPAEPSEASEALDDNDGLEDAPASAVSAEDDAGDDTAETDTEMGEDEQEPPGREQHGRTALSSDGVNPHALRGTPTDSSGASGASGASGSSVDVAIAVWLHAKAGRSNSHETHSAYSETLAAFRARLQTLGMDLNTPISNLSEPHPIALAAQAWAFQRADGVTPVAGATANQRLAILSSFYTFAARRRLLAAPDGLPLAIPNPISEVERAKVQAYANVQALSAEVVEQQLAAIDRTTLAGKRDYALIALALQTGRRASELSNLTFGDLQIEYRQRGHPPRVTVLWRRTKGGKRMRDILDDETAAVLLTWLTAARSLSHGPAEQPVTLENTSSAPSAADPADPATAVEATGSRRRVVSRTVGTPGFTADSPIFISLSRSSRGHPLTRQALADIWSKRLGTSKVHVTRHTFARNMEDEGAHVSEIQRRLGHESLATTGRYLAQLTSDENPYAAKLAKRFGIVPEDNEDNQAGQPKAQPPATVSEQGT